MSTWQSIFESLPALVPLIGSSTLDLVYPSAAQSTMSMPAQPARAQSAPGHIKRDAPRAAMWAAMFETYTSDLLGLKQGWDGYRSVPPSRRALLKARLLTFEVLKDIPNATCPYIVPAGDGSVQLEWHEAHGELELHIDAEGTLSIWGQDRRINLEFEGEGDQALALFYRWAPWTATSLGHATHARAPSRHTFFEIAA